MSARKLGAAALITVAMLMTAGCSASTPTEPASSGAHTSAAESQQHTSGVTFTDGWAKAGDGMTGVFGTVTNNGDADVVLERVESPAAAMVELHETTTVGGNATMSEVEGGFVIPAGGSFELAPGGNHIMFMDLAQPLLAGDEVPLMLSFDDGTVIELSVLVKDYDGAQENYAGAAGTDEDSAAHAGHAGMSHDEHAE